MHTNACLYTFCANLCFCTLWALFKFFLLESMKATFAQIKGFRCLGSVDRELKHTKNQQRFRMAQTRGRASGNETLARSSLDRSVCHGSRGPDERLSPGVRSFKAKNRREAQIGAKPRISSFTGAFCLKMSQQRGLRSPISEG